jgi:hypothetical protein
MGTLTAHADLLVGDHTVRDARAFALSTTAAWDCEVPLETLLLLVEELAGAVRDRAGTEHSLTLMFTVHDGQDLRVTLADGAAVRATAEQVVRGAPTLAGLLGSLAGRWGDEPYRGGYSLWFELGVADPEPADEPSRPDEPDVELEIEAYLQHHRGVEPPAVDPATAERLEGWLARGHG